MAVDSKSPNDSYHGLALALGLLIRFRVCLMNFVEACLKSSDKESLASVTFGFNQLQSIGDDR
jgi:hypothetical protein